MCKLHRPGITQAVGQLKESLDYWVRIDYYCVIILRNSARKSTALDSAVMMGEEKKRNIQAT